MTRFVADVGGTNARFGVARDGALDQATVRSYANEAFGDFAEAVTRYRVETAGLDFSQMVVAVAGPVTGGQARLTNRDWRFDAEALSARFGAEVALLNDLGALGHALPLLDAAQCRSIFRPDPPPARSGQSLVVGVGTGFNVSPVVTVGARSVHLLSEYGHTRMPVSVWDRLHDALGRKADGFRTVEDCFSGRGFLTAQALFRKAGGPDAFEPFYAGLLATLTSDLVLAFLPMDGVYFAGGVARNLLTSAAGPRFAEGFERECSRKFGFTAPVGVIMDDAAALKGCAHFDFPRADPS